MITLLAPDELNAQHVAACQMADILEEFAVAYQAAKTKTFDGKKLMLTMFHHDVQKFRAAVDMMRQGHYTRAAVMLHHLDAWVKMQLPPTVRAWMQEYPT